MILEVLEADDAEEACQNVERLIQNLNCFPSLADAGVVSDEQIRAIASRVNLERLANNPRRITQDQLIALLRRSQTSPR